jgi:hypothetical protein
MTTFGAGFSSDEVTYGPSVLPNWDPGGKHVFALPIRCRNRRSEYCWMRSGARVALIGTDEVIE